MDRTRFPSARVMEDDSDLTEMECVGWRDRAQLVVSVSFHCPTPQLLMYGPKKLYESSVFSLSDAAAFWHPCVATSPKSGAAARRRPCVAIGRHRLGEIYCSISFDTPSPLRCHRPPSDTCGLRADRYPATCCIYPPPSDPASTRPLELHTF